MCSSPLTILIFVYTDAVVKSRPTAQLQVPYLLPLSPAHFNAMVPGRRKAIEVSLQPLFAFVHVQISDANA